MLFGKYKVWIEIEPMHGGEHYDLGYPVPIGTFQHVQELLNFLETLGVDEFDRENVYGLIISIATERVMAELSDLGLPPQTIQAVRDELDMRNAAQKQVTEEK